ncbi:MAG TPA: YraN family protein [Xylanibacter oryzae]|nr:YraN family protein [Xylanibacter oryzae]
MAAHNNLGSWGEEKAVEYLKRKGFQILHRDWKYQRRDLDIVASIDNQLVIVEVKTRKKDTVLAPEMAVDRRKVRSLMIAANAYIKLFKIDKEVRFDIIAILGDNNDNMEINHIEDAFLPIPY